MPRALRIEYPGAIYHVMNRGDRREPNFRDDLDHQRLLTTLAEACTKTDWQIHANGRDFVARSSATDGGVDACGQPPA